MKIGSHRCCALILSNEWELRYDRKLRENRQKMSQHFRIGRVDFRGLDSVWIAMPKFAARYFTHLQLGGVFNLFFFLIEGLSSHVALRFEKFRFNFYLIFGYYYSSCYFIVDYLIIYLSCCLLLQLFPMII